MHADAVRRGMPTGQGTIPYGTQEKWGKPGLNATA